MLHIPIEQFEPVKAFLLFRIILILLDSALLLNESITSRPITCEAKGLDVRIQFTMSSRMAEFFATLKEFISKDLRSTLGFRPFHFA